MHVNLIAIHVIIFIPLHHELLFLDTPVLGEVEL